jgi:hypothetical protein
MTRSRLLPIVGLVVIALVTAFAVVLVSSFGDGDDAGVTATIPEGLDRGQERSPGSGLPAIGIEARGVLEPRIVLFGDTISARVDVLLDRSRVDPGSVRVSTEFLPWEIISPQKRVRTDSGSETYVRTTFTLRCTGSPCLPANLSSALEFTAARVSYARRRAAPGARDSIAVKWPLLLVYSRFAAANLDGAAGPSSVAPWRADLESLPAASYRISPNLLLPVLLALAGLLVVAGVVLAYVAIPRRAAIPEPEPEPEPEPVIVLTPLEQALELLEDASLADGAEDRRRALELVAEVLDLDHADLARAARTLAWSEDDPLVDQTSGLATRVRASIDMNGNGRAH